MNIKPETSVLSLLREANNLDECHYASISYANNAGLLDYTLLKLDLSHRHSAAATLFTNKHFKVSALLKIHSYDEHIPALQICQKKTTPFVELQSRYRTRQFLPLDRFYEYCQTGLTIPLISISVYFPFHIRYQYNGFFMLSGNTDNLQHLCDQLLDGMLFADYLANKICHLQESRTAGMIELTEKESLCLYVLADGGTYEDVSQALGIAKETVNYYIKKLITKFGAKNRYQAIALAISKSLVVPQT